MAELEFTIEYGMYGMHAKPLKGALWRARFYDRELGRHYAGSADCPFEAIAWALVEREERIANNGHPTITKSDVETPVQALARLRTEQSLWTRDPARNANTAGSFSFTPAAAYSRAPSASTRTSPSPRTSTTTKKKSRSR